MKDCVSLEIAKQLKGAGWVTGDFNNRYVELATGWVFMSLGTWGEQQPRTRGTAPYIAAPTIGELLEALPCEVTFQGKEYWLGLLKGFDGAKHYYEAAYTTPEERSYALAENPNPADALALLWMELKKKNIL